MSERGWGMWVRGGGDYWAAWRRYFYLWRWQPLWVGSGLPAPGAAACRGYGGKAVVGGGRTGMSGRPYLNEEVDAGGHGGRKICGFYLFFPRSVGGISRRFFLLSLLFCC